MRGYGHLKIPLSISTLPPIRAPIIFMEITQVEALPNRMVYFPMIKRAFMKPDSKQKTLLILLVRDYGRNTKNSWLLTTGEPPI